MIAFVALLLMTSLSANAQSVDFGGPSLNFGGVSLGTAKTIPMIYHVLQPTTFGTTKVLTQGASGLDFQLNYDGCGNSTIDFGVLGVSCTVYVTFSPLALGQRMGVVQLTDSSNNVLLTTWVYGSGQGPAIAFTPGIINTVAGNSTPGYSGDGGAATSAELNQPFSVALDSAGSLYIAELSNSIIRKVDANGIISTVAGNGTAGYSGDGGAATSAELNQPTGLALDGAGNLYIADQGNNRIRKVDGRGIITTVAGPGFVHVPACNPIGDGCVAVDAELDTPTGVAVDVVGNLYIADQGNNRIRKVDSSGTITTVAGNGTVIGGIPECGFIGDGCVAVDAELDTPTGVAVDVVGNLYIADQGHNRLRKVDASGIITTVAGNGTAGYSGDDGVATSAELDQPAGVALDSAGNLYFAQPSNSVIRKVGVNGIISRVAGDGIYGVINVDGYEAIYTELFAPTGVAVDGAGNLYIADTNNQRVRKVDVTTSTHRFPHTNVFTTSSDSPVSVTVENVGNETLTGGVSVSPNSFLQVPGSASLADCNSSFSLASGARCFVSLSFVPQVAGTITGAATFTDNELNATPSATQTITLQGPGFGVPQTITFSINAPSSAPYNSSFTVAATGGASGNPVIFTSSGACTNSGATYTMTAATGTCSVIANQAGSADRLAAPQVTQTVNAALGIQTITFTTNPPSSAVYNSRFTVAATGGPSGNPVVFVSSGVCIYVGATYTMTSGTGTCTVIATEAGNANYASATVTRTVNATPLSQTLTFTSNPPSSAAYNSQFTVAATGGATGNPIMFASSGACTNLGATYTMTSGTGTCSVIANQAGNSNYSPGTATRTVNATPLSQAITFTTNPPANAAYGSSFTVAATGGASGNPVTFTSAGACSNVGATYTMTSGTGTCSVIANQSANANYSAATQVTRTANATLAAQTITFPVIPTQTGPGTVTLTATASSGLAITYSVASGPATVAGNTLTTTGAGSITVKAIQAGNANYSAATPVSRSFTVNPNAGTLTGHNCNGEYTGVYVGALTVSAGQTCIFTNGSIAATLTLTGGTVVLENNSFVGGNVQMSGGSFSITGSTVAGSAQITGGTFSIGPSATIGGNLQIQNLPAGGGTDQVCGATVRGSLTVQNSATPVQIGSGSGCAGNSIGGNLQVQSNSATTAIYSNSVTGFITDINNTGASQVFTNVSSVLQCSGNHSITGGGNRAITKQGQCATF
jgi:hypothetical protein